jgi:hypothetical protein
MSDLQDLRKLDRLGFVLGDQLDRLVAHKDDKSRVNIPDVLLEGFRGEFAGVCEVPLPPLDLALLKGFPE